MELNIDKYLNGDVAQNGDIVTWLSEGEEKQMKDKETQEVKTVYNFDVEFNQKKLIYTPNFTTLKLLRKAWGNNTKNWIGKQFECRLVLMSVKGKEMYVIRPQILTQ